MTGKQPSEIGTRFEFGLRVDGKLRSRIGERGSQSNARDDIGQRFAAAIVIARAIGRHDRYVVALARRYRRTHTLLVRGLEMLPRGDGAPVTERLF